MWTCLPLHNPLQCEVAQAICQAFLPKLHILLTGRTWEQHGGMGGVLPPPSWVRPAHWEEEERTQVGRGDQTKVKEKVSVRDKLIETHGDNSKEQKCLTLSLSHTLMHTDE